VGESEADARARLPCPATATSREIWGADGEWHFALEAHACGVTLGLASPTPDGPARVVSVSVEAPGDLATARGIRVGASEAEALRAYRSDLDAEATRPGEVVVAGSLYGGLVFSLRDGKVTRVFLGAAAE
jgi:hypothetical protein